MKRTLLVCSLSLGFGFATGAATHVPRPLTMTLSTQSPSTSWKVSVGLESTKIRRIAGSQSWSKTVPGRWELPLVTVNGERGGPSFDGTTLALSVVGDDSETPSPNQKSKFLVVSKDNQYELDLAGRWLYDATSVEGSRLFLAEYVGKQTYFVRAVDVRTARPYPRIVAKSFSAASTADTPGAPAGIDEGPMSGRPLVRVTSIDGSRVFTLYDGPGHPFVHALDVKTGGALCYDLPADMKTTVSSLRLALGPVLGLVNVVRDGTVVAQVVDLPHHLGPSVRLAGTSQPPIR